MREWLILSDHLGLINLNKQLNYLIEYLLSVHMLKSCYLVRTIATASFNILSPNTNMFSKGSTFKAWKMANVATGSTAEISEPNTKLKNWNEKNLGKRGIPAQYLYSIKILLASFVIGRYTRKSMQGWQTSAIFYHLEFESLNLPFFWSKWVNNVALKRMEKQQWYCIANEKVSECTILVNIKKIKYEVHPMQVALVMTLSWLEKMIFHRIFFTISVLYFTIRKKNNLNVIKKE